MEKKESKEKEENHDKEISGDDEDFPKHKHVTHHEHSRKRDNTYYITLVVSALLIYAMLLLKDTSKTISVICGIIGAVLFVFSLVKIE